VPRVRVVFFPLAAAVLLTVVPATAAPPADNARPLRLRAEGPMRVLPPKLLGASAESLIEHLIDTPAKVQAIQATAPGVIRFPGGSQANYYDWRTGLLEFHPQANSSAYYKFWSAAAPKIARAMPKGVSMEEYARFASAINADVILVPNLETSTVDDQVEWLKRLAAAGCLPKDIELGNEFWIAMAGDPNVMAKWPDEPRSMAEMKRFADALRPVVGAGAKLAVQAAGAAFTIKADRPLRFQKRLLDWDAALKPEDWFQAVTVHLYPDPHELAERAGNPAPEELFALLMGRADAGVDRALDDLARRLPGKEIWITEWSPRGGNFTDLDQRDFVTQAMAFQLVARETMSILRHPAVTRSLYFTLGCDTSLGLRAYVRTGSSYAPLPATLVLQWFDEAANAGASFQRLVDADTPAVTGLGEFAESFRPVEGVRFASPSGSVVIVQNASAEYRIIDAARLLDAAQINSGRPPARAELLVAGDFSDQRRLPASPQALAPDKPLVLPPYSLARLVWGKE
jgi:hypothetical protein